MNFENAIKELNIVNLMCIGFADYEEYINGKIKESEEYGEAEEVLKKCFDKIEEKEGSEFMGELDDAIIAMEAEAKDIAFNEGFKLGVRLMMNCLNAGTAGGAKK